jgi:glycosyltransferase involved in cell wall biosynthesis
MKTILSFGHLPKFVGGRQSSGLAYVIWKLADSINKIDHKDIESVLVATDVKKRKDKIGTTMIYGWTNRMIFYAFFKYFKSLIQIILYSIKLKWNYKYPLLKTVVQLVFFNYVTIKYKDKSLILHAHGVNNYMLIRFLSKKYKKPIFLTIHGTTGGDKNIPNWKTQNKIERFVIGDNRMFLTVFITTQIISEWENLYGELDINYTVILNGVDKDVFYFDPSLLKVNSSNTIKILTIGAISELKGQERVINAIRELPKGIRKKYEYYIIGKGDEENVNQLIKVTRGDDIFFKYLGYMEPMQIRNILHEVDYLIQPSSTEGFGLVFLESIACGTPVILPKHLPIAKEKKLLTEENAIFIEDESSESIMNLLLNLPGYKFRRKEVSESIKDISWNNIAQEYAKIIDYCIL